MQTASDNYALAASGATVLWAPRKVMVDWAGDGFTTDRQPGATFLVRDRFDRTSASGWGAADSGQEWSNTGSASNFEVTPGTGLIHCTVASETRYLRVGQDIADSDVLVDFGASVLAAGGSMSLSVLTRYADTNNHLRARVTIQTDQTINVALITGVSAVFTTVASLDVPGLVHAVGREFTVRVQTKGQLWRAKVWRRGYGQPAAWQVSTTTNAAMPDPGRVGMRAISSGVAPMDFSVTRFDMLNGEVDDMSDLVGEGIKVEHSLDDGLPQEITSFLSGSGAATASVPVVYGRGGITLASRFLSPFNTESPLAGYSRDTAPITIDAGLVTESGIERVRVFTGQMANTPIKGKQAAIEAISANRLKMTRLAQPPSVLGSVIGLNGSWLVSWALWQSGVAASPPPRGGCRCWWPLHGSMFPFIPDNHVNVGTNVYRFFEDDDVIMSEIVRPTWIEGPWVLAADCRVGATARYRVAGAQMALGPGDDLLSRSGNCGRVEFWVKGDPTNYNGSPGGSGTVSRTAAFHGVQTTGQYVKCGVNVSRYVYIEVYDGSTTDTLSHPTPVPEDGEWHFVGCAWDLDNSGLWVNLDGVVHTYTPLSLVSRLPAVDNWDTSPSIQSPSMVSYLPLSDFYLTAGSLANPDTSGEWANEWDSSEAVIKQSTIELVGTPYMGPLEMWDLVTDLARCEMAVVRTDEYDRVLYLPPSHWSKTAQQAITDTLSTTTNVESLPITYDPSAVRNSVRVRYSNTRIVAATEVFSDNPSGTDAYIEPGVNLREVQFSRPVTHVDEIVYVYNGTQAAGVGSLYVRVSYVTINSLSDGSGSYADASIINSSVLSWHTGGAVIQIINLSNSRYYLVNNESAAPFMMAATAMIVDSAYVVASSSGSMAQDGRGERGLALDMPLIQTEISARRLASKLLGQLGKPRPRIERVRVFGDPRRQPGDLVRVADAANTAADGLWRLNKIVHNIEGAKYTQTVDLVRAYQVGTWGDPDSAWGSTLWGKAQ